MDIKILTTGCCDSHSLYDRVQSILDSTRIEASVERIEDLETVMSYDVMSTPALVIDGEVQVAGRVPSADELGDLLTSV